MSRTEKDGWKIYDRNVIESLINEGKERILSKDSRMILKNNLIFYAEWQEEKYRVVPGNFENYRNEEASYSAWLATRDIEFFNEVKLKCQDIVAQAKRAPESVIIDGVKLRRTGVHEEGKTFTCIRKFPTKTYRIIYKICDR